MKSYDIKSIATIIAELKEVPEEEIRIKDMMIFLFNRIVDLERKVKG